MRINHNIASLNTHRQLTSNTTMTGKALEKLSSGLRINRAGDDAAGLAISEKMRGQIRGLEMASKNAQDGISLIQTAEGALNETHSILQRMRELAVQSANDTNTADDRTKLQSEVDQLAKEITRVSNTTEFNNRNLLNGGIQTGNVGELRFHIGSNAGQNLDLAINAMDAASLGVARDGKTETLTSGVGITDSTLATGSTIAAGVYTISSTLTASGTAGQLAAGTGLTGADTASGAGSFTVTVDGTAVNVAYASGDTLSGVVSGLNTQLSGIGTATISGGSIVITSASTGTTSTAAISAATGTILTPATAATVTIGTGLSGTLVQSGGSFTVTIGSGAATAITIVSGETVNDLVTTLNTQLAGSGSAALVGSGIVITSTATGTAATIVVTSGTGANTYNIGAATDSGAASGSTTASSFGVTNATDTGTAAAMTVTLTPASGTALTATNVAVDETSIAISGGLTLTKDAAVTSGLAGTVTVAVVASSAATFSGGVQTSGAIAYGGIDVSTQSGANAAITVLTTAIETVSAERSKLGAYQNRLEHTINNLGTTSENLTASESRIRDVDMAKEMMEFTKNNILTQAAQAMLAQANQQPQGVLQLLR